MKKIMLLVFILVPLSTALVIIFTRPVVSYSAETELLMEVDLPVHNIDSGENFSTIQEAINDNETLDGHTILVDAGTYYENVVVNKTVSLIGESRGTTIIDANGTGNVIDVRADGVVIEGFTIQNSGYDMNSIQVHGFQYRNATIRNNTIINNDGGISIFDSNEHNISGNDITNNYYGIILQYSYGNTLRDNHMSGNQRNFFVWGDFPFYYYHDIDSSNTVDGKPMYYWVNQQNRTVPVDAGYVALIDSVNITVQNLTLKNNSQGILLVETKNSIINSNNITNNRWGIHLLFSFNNTISGNNIMNRGTGILLDSSVNNTIFGNNLKNNYFGIDLSYHFMPSTTNNTIYHNNFVNNTQHVWISTRPVYANFWDNGVEGNYWSNYTGVDSDHDGIGDTSHVIDASNEDNRPLMGVFHSFNTSLGYNVNVISNSTIEDFTFLESNSTIRMYVSNSSATQSFGFCRVCIPKGLMSPLYTVIIDDGLTEVLYFNGTVHDNGTHMWIYFAYEHSTHKVDIIPEFPTWTPMLFILIVFTVAIAIYKRRLPKTPIN